jgi:hypothetical protein
MTSTTYPPIPSLPTPPQYHGITVRDAVLLIHSHGGTCTAAQVRKWVQRGQVHRTRDGQIDPFTLLEWVEYQASKPTRRQQVA